MRIGFAAAAIAVSFGACNDVNPAGPPDSAGDIEPRMLINGEDDFGHLGTAAIMTYDPSRPAPERWRSFCSGALIHRRPVRCSTASTPSRTSGSSLM
jgi:hypothetical protein